MMKNIYLVICIVCSLSLFGQVEDSGISQVALMLHTEETAELYDEIKSAFDELDDIHIVDRPFIVHAVYHNDTTNKILSAMLNYKLLKKMHKSNKNFYKYCSPSELEYLSKELAGSRYLLWPQQMEMKTIQKVNNSVYQIIQGKMLLLDLSEATVLMNESFKHRADIENSSDMNIAIRRVFAEDLVRKTSRLID